MEVIVVIALMGILMAIAVPPFLSWRQNMMYRQAAKGITTALADAKSRAIATNRQHRIEFSAGSKTYKLLRGGRSYGSSEPLTSTGSTSNPLPGGLLMDLGGAANLKVDFYPNGTSSGGTIRITESSSPRYQVRVEPTGRIQLDRLY